MPELDLHLRSPRVVAKFTALDRTGTAEAIIAPVDRSVANSLMLPLRVIVVISRSVRQRIVGSLEQATTVIAALARVERRRSPTDRQRPGSSPDQSSTFPPATRQSAARVKVTDPARRHWTRSSLASRGSIDVTDRHRADPDAPDRGFACRGRGRRSEAGLARRPLYIELAGTTRASASDSKTPRTCSAPAAAPSATT